MDNSLLIHLAETSSTSECLKGHGLPHGLCVWADFQTAGRGQGSNRWESSPGENLLFSLLLHPAKITPDRQFVLTEIVTTAMHRVLQPLVSTEISVKWPNDIYAGNGKLCGILIENTLLGNRWENAVIGIGLNVNQTIFRSDAPNPVSLRSIAGREFCRNALLVSLVDSILETYESYDDSSRSALHSSYMSRLYRRDGFFPYETADGERFTARIDSIDDMGLLTLVTPDGLRRTFMFKEVRHIL
ncbi:MAG: biotin--[acetyl-CoA-carboxylase] ligase [bacterium]|uniref:Biotin--[acetyl-CoA-carboxylase] ligase n=1 Tax=Candidatus Aphodosoma intestinipullorum TaxID=2840674 RepID=A0A940DMX1_9BACT|nr:biotin--[acetyl-CoA-carboxylase] ligase [Candidatus Aphodosoma intestinipullorum]